MLTSSGLAGVELRALLPHADDRGVFTEVFRNEWGTGSAPHRWEVLRMAPASSRSLGEGRLVVVRGRAELTSGGDAVALDADAPVLVVVASSARATLQAYEEEVVVVVASQTTAAMRPRSPQGPAGPALPDGVRLMDLPTTDETVALFDRMWGLGTEPVQWNAVRSLPGVLRGVHCHARHADLLHVAEGRMRLALADLRGGERLVGCIDLAADRPQMVVIPPGVAHGFLFLEPSLHIYAVDHTWDTADELGCRWDDAALAIPWGHVPARVSPRDEALGSLAKLTAALAR